MKLECKQANWLKPGIISLWIGGATAFITFFLFVAFFFTKSNTRLAQEYGEILFVYALIVAPIFHLLCLIFGFGGLFLSNAKKRYAVCGIIFNGAALAIAAVCWGLILYLLFLIIKGGGIWR